MVCVCVCVCVCSRFFMFSDFVLVVVAQYCIVRYRGEWRIGLRHGFGTYVSKDGDVYTGVFVGALNEVVGLL